MRLYVLLGHRPMQVSYLRQFSFLLLEGHRLKLPVLLLYLLVQGLRLYYRRQHSVLGLYLLLPPLLRLANPPDLVLHLLLLALFLLNTQALLLLALLLLSIQAPPLLDLPSLHSFGQQLFVALVYLFHEVLVLLLG